MYGKLDDKVRQFLLEAFKDATLSDKDIAYLLYNTEALYSETKYSHRWWDDIFNVIKVEDRLIGYEWSHATGDTSVSDLGWEFDLCTVCFCEAYEVTETKYRKVSDVGKKE